MANAAAFSQVDLVVAMFLMVAALMPLGMTLAKDSELYRAWSLRARAMTVVDGELEVLAAGVWKEYGPGEHELVPKSGAELSGYGSFRVLVDAESIQVRWIPGKKYRGGTIVRTAVIKSGDGDIDDGVSGQSEDGGEGGQ